MVKVNIIIDQLTLGKAGISRDDLVLNEEITLRNDDNSNITSWQWEFISKPSDSNTILNNKNSTEATFMPDVVGSYLIKLMVNS